MTQQAVVRIPHVDTARASAVSPAADAQLCPCCCQRLPESPELIVDEAGILIRGGRFAALTKQEFAMFEALRAANSRVRSKEQLLQDVYWRLADEEPGIKIIDVWVCKLRTKLRPLGIEIQTVWAKGYRLLPAGGHS